MTSFGVPKADNLDQSQKLIVLKQALADAVAEVKSKQTTEKKLVAKKYKAEQSKIDNEMAVESDAGEQTTQSDNDKALLNSEKENNSEAPNHYLTHASF